MACACQQAIAGVDGGECDALVNFGVWPSNVAAFKARIGTVAEALDLGVRACRDLPAADRASWELFIAEWRAFVAKSVGWFGAYNEWAQTCAHAKTLDGWIEKLKSAQCYLPGPEPIKGAEGATSVVKWLAAAVIVTAVVGGGVYVARMVR